VLETELHRALHNQSANAVRGSGRITMARNITKTDRGGLHKLTGSNQAQPEDSALSSGATRNTCTGLGLGMKVLTLDGAIPVEFLNPGDRIITRAGVRRLRAISARVIPKGMIARINPAVLTGAEEGAARSPLTLGADQPILLRDWRARALFGRAQVIAPLRALADDEHITMAVASEARLFTLKFDTAEVIYVEGLEVAVGADVTCEAIAA
jgi:hypothetical protein